VRILILNWRDPCHPKARGAEIVTRKFAQEWIAAGHCVTWFASAFGSAPATEVLDDGIRVMRAGREWTVQWHAQRAFRRGKLAADLVVDEIHGFGFMTPWYVPE